MVDLLAECGDAFPDATDWALDYLQPIDAHLFSASRERTGHVAPWSDTRNPQQGYWSRRDCSAIPTHISQNS